MRTFLLSAVSVLACSLGGAQADDFPSRDIKGVIQWGAGGSTDTTMRALVPHAEKVLGGVITLQNLTGAVGAVALSYVARSEPDGYTLLMGAENPLLYKVMGLSDMDYSNFIPLTIVARGTPVLVAHPDAPFDDYGEMVAYIKAHPAQVRIGATGPGGLPSVITAMMTKVEGDLDVTTVPYEGDGPAITALTGGAIDVMPAVLGAAIEGIAAGELKPLAVMDLVENPHLPGVPPVAFFHPGFEAYLPWNSFMGVFAPEGTPQAVADQLSAAFTIGAQNPDFIAMMEDRGFQLMGISGQQATDFLENWQRTTTWLLQDAGLTKASPAEFGIARPDR